MNVTNLIDRLILRLEDLEQSRMGRMKIGQLAAPAVLVAIGAGFWFSVLRWEFMAYLLVGFLAGLAGVRPWWAAPALSIAPAIGSIYCLQTERIGICSQISVVFGLAMVLGGTGLSALIGNLIRFPNCVRHCLDR
jgi:hypothetical protein